MDPIIDEWQKLRDEDEEYNERRTELWLAQPPPLNIQDCHYVCYPPLARFLQDPAKLAQLHRALCKRPKNGYNKYFVTFTHDPKTPIEKFKPACEKQINRKTFSDFEYCFEHEDTNLHCHALLTSRFTINLSNFKAHIRKHGRVHVKKVNIDNGIEEYMTKENTIIRKNKNLADK